MTDEMNNAIQLRIQSLIENDATILFNPTLLQVELGSKHIGIIVIQ